MSNFDREMAQKCFSEESTWRQNDDIKRDLIMVCCKDGRFIKLELGFFYKLEYFVINSFKKKI